MTPLEGGWAKARLRQGTRAKTGHKAIAGIVPEMHKVELQTTFVLHPHCPVVSLGSGAVGVTNSGLEDPEVRYTAVYKEGG